MADHDYDPLFAAMFDPTEAPAADIDPTHWVYGILLFLFSLLTLLFGMGAYSLYISYVLAGDICNDVAAPLWCNPLQQERGKNDEANTDRGWSVHRVPGGPGYRALRSDGDGPRD